MSRIASVVLVAMVGVLAACGGKDKEAETPGTGSVVGIAPGVTIEDSVVDLPTTNVPVSIYEDKVISDAEAVSLVGMAEAAALREAQARGWRVRVVGRDGEAYAVTMDYSAGRLNFTITNGVITASTVG